MFFAALVTAALTVYACAASTGGAVVKATALNVRSGASASSPVLTVAPGGAAVTVYGNADNGWYEVRYNGISGYMSAEYLTFSETLEAQLGSGVVRGTSVRLRSGPGYDAGILGYCDTGAGLTLLGVSGEWMKVSVNGAVGYMHSDYIEHGASAVETGSQSSSGGAIVDTAYKYLNVPYVWGGTSPYGFDCSGLVYYVFAEHGYSVNRTAASLYNNGVAVDRTELVPGDIICFTNGSYSYIGHVGIYAGDGNFIHASSGTGYVTVSNLSENYYNNHYYGSRRIAA